jgi:hypothetical protein
MSTAYPRLPGPIGGIHSEVLDRRIRDLLLFVAAGVVPLALALVISIEEPKPNLLMTLALIVGGLGVVMLVASSRLALTVTLLALYLGLLDGPIKLGTGAHESASVIRDVLIFAVSLGAVLRLVVKRERITLPPLFGWVLAFVAIVLVEAFNPKTHGILHILGGFRQQLEWVPFFFFGYVLVRTKVRFRALFLIVGVIALANGVVATYQTQLSPQQVASWGPGYRDRIFPSANGLKGGARTFVSGGEGHVRPFGLGSDSGFSGGVGLLALPFCLALLAGGAVRRRWVAIALSLGAMVAVVTGLGRLQVVGALLAVGFFALLSFASARRVTRPLIALLAVVILAIPLGALFVSAEGSGTFARYASLAPGSAANTTTSYKESDWTKIPSQIAAAPFGVGLGTVGAAGGFGGRITELVNGHGVTAETQYNFITDELGLPGLIVYVALGLNLILLVVTRLRRIPDVEVRIYLAGLFAPFIAIMLAGFSGPIMTSAALGPYYWFAAGVAGYWLMRFPRVGGTPSPAPAISAGGSLP